MQIGYPDVACWKWFAASSANGLLRRVQFLAEFLQRFDGGKIDEELLDQVLDIAQARIQSKEQRHDRDDDAAAQVQHSGRDCQRGQEQQDAGGLEDIS